MTETQRVSVSPVSSGETLLAGGEAPPLRPAPSSNDADPRLGTLLKDTYRVLRKLGEGGMGSVYLAEHCSIGKKVAIKVLGDAYLHRPELSERFLREARAAAMIESDHVIEIHDFGTTPDGAAFFVMEYLQGEDLAHLLAREGPLPWARVRPMLLQLCAALQAAHDRGIYHRDIKPENCYRLARSGDGDAIKILDFGIAKVLTDEADGGKQLTRTGMIFGTPDYMSPEQAQGAPHDHRVDIYATGVILFELLTGDRPFHADTFMGLLNKHMFEPPPRPSSVDPKLNIAPEVEAIILKALQKDPALRFQSMTEFAAAASATGTGAAPVAVVAEKLPRPIAPGPAVGFRGEAPPAPRRRWLAPLLAAVAAAGIVTTVLVLADDAPAAADHPKRAARTVKVATNPELLPLEPAPTKASPELLPLQPVPEVSLKIRTGAVAAEILDAQGRRLGSTSDPAGVRVPQGAAPISLTLRADGYDELALQVVPDHDLELDRADALQRRAPQPATQRPRKKDPGAPTKAITPPTKKVDPGSPDLMPLGG